MNVAENRKETLNLVLIATIGGMALYLLSKVGKVGAAATNAISSSIASAAISWDNLIYGGPIQVLGNVALPDGSVAAISSLEWRHDNQGNTYTQWNNSVYELAARDSSGNFTLQAVA